MPQGAEGQHGGVNMPSLLLSLMHIRYRCVAVCHHMHPRGPCAPQCVPPPARATPPPQSASSLAFPSTALTGTLAPPGPHLGARTPNPHPSLASLVLCFPSFPTHSASSLAFLSAALDSASVTAADSSPASLVRSACGGRRGGGGKIAKWYASNARRVLQAKYNCYLSGQLASQLGALGLGGRERGPTCAPVLSHA